MASHARSILLPLDAQGGFVFIIRKDPELIERFGPDEDFQTDSEEPVFNKTIIDLN